MNRRNFIKSTLAVTTYSGLNRISTAAQEKNNAAPMAKRHVIVLGAGLAGLSATLELSNAGHDVTILEARARPGGRVYTMREPFSDGLYAETGAARIQDSHEFTMRYVKQFNLSLDPFFPTEGAAVVFIKGKRIVVPFGRRAPEMADLPLNFSEEEKKLGLMGSQVKYIFSHMPKIGDAINPDWSSASLKQLEVSIPDFLRQQGASEGLTKMVAFGHDLSSMSVLMLLRDTAVGANTKMWYKIRGGNDQLPKGIAVKLSDKIRYGAPVVRIEQDAGAVRAVFLQAGVRQTVSGDYLISTIPLPVMRRIEVSPLLSVQKRKAIEDLDYLAMTRVFLQSRRRFWNERGESGFANSDDPLDVWDYTRHQPGQRGILGAYISGRLARQLSYQTSGERENTILEMIERIHPGIRENFETSASHSWTTDPWSLGAGAEFKAGQMTAFAPHLSTPEGRIHFAGDHTSAWNGWMNGALESGHRAAKEIQVRG